MSDKKVEKKDIPRSNSFWVPIAIILAGVIIAGAVVYSDKADNGGVELAGSAEEALPEQPTPPEPGTEKFTVSADDDAVKGNKNAQVEIVEFSDYECPYCASNAETIKKIADEYGDQVAIIFRDFPLDFHANAQKAAEAAECAGDQNMYWEYHDMLFANQDSLEIPDLKGYAKELKLKTSVFDKCLDSGAQTEEVKKDIADGAEVGVTGTPATYINGRKIGGAYPYESFKKIIDEELAK